MKNDEPSSDQQITVAEQREKNVTHDTITIPVIEEHVNIDKKVVETARVRISKSFNEEAETFDVPLLQEEVVVERIPKNEYIDTLPPASRYEGDTMIIPVIKEVLIVEKKLMLVEEVRVSKKLSQKNEKTEVILKKEQVSIERREIDTSNI